MFEAVMLFLIGIILVAVGVVGIKAPMVAWKLWIARILLVKNGEPTDFYYWLQKKLGWLSVVLGICVMIAGGIQLKAIMERLTITLDGKEVALPCKYEDFEKIGYKLVDEDDKDEIRGEGVRYCVLSEENGKEIVIIVENDKKQPRDMEDCEIVSISVDMDNAPVVGVEDMFDTTMNKDEIIDICAGMADKNLKGDVIEIDMSNAFEDYFVNIYYDKSGENGIIESIIIKYGNNN